MRSTIRASHRGVARRRRPLPLLAAVLMLVVLAGLAAAVSALGGSDAPAKLPRDALRVNVGAIPESRPVPSGDIGLSIEYRSALQYFGTDPAHPDPVFVALIRALDPGGSPVLRFGGDTTDWTWWRTPGVARPAGVRFTIGPRWARAVAGTAAAANARLIFGINFEADSRRIASFESHRLLQLVGRRFIAGLELGNEPEAYGALGWYANAAGQGVLGRPAGYGFADYLRDYPRVLSGLPGSVPVVGPASGVPAWLTGLGVYLHRDRRVRLVTFHRYPLHRCFTPRNSMEYPTIGHLLAPIASSGPADSLVAAVTTAHAAGRPFRVDELNSVSCGGARGVSDTFAAALWVLDTLFHMTQAGVDGVNIHTFQKAVYEPFAFSHRDGRWTAQVRPLYYGLLMFARAAPPGARLLPVDVPAAARAPAGALRAWATSAPDRRLRVVFINDASQRSALVAVRVPASAATASVQRLRAPHVGARLGITLGGQSFGATTSTGTLPGSPRSASLTAIRGRFVVRVAPDSAVLLTVRGARTG